MKQLKLNPAQVDYIVDLLVEKQNEADDAGKQQLVDAIDDMIVKFENAEDVK